MNTFYHFYENDVLSGLTNSLVSTIDQPHHSQTSPDASSSRHATTLFLPVLGVDIGTVCYQQDQSVSKPLWTLQVACENS